MEYTIGTPNWLKEQLSRYGKNVWAVLTMQIQMEGFGKTQVWNGYLNDILKFHYLDHIRSMLFSPSILEENLHRKFHGDLRRRNPKKS